MAPVVKNDDIIEPSADQNANGSAALEQNNSEDMEKYERRAQRMIGRYGNCCQLINMIYAITKRLFLIIKLKSCIINLEGLKLI